VSSSLKDVDLYSDDSKPLSELLARSDIAKDVASARELIQWYGSNIDKSKVFFGIAEQFRYFNAFR
jgi:hypothetical protein